MLEAIRRNSRSTIIYVLFAVLIAVFVINFGPGSGGGCGTALSTSYAARVAGSTISEQDYRASYVLLGGPQIPIAFQKERHLKEFVMDKLIERELLADEAERLGFNVSQKEAEDQLATGKMYILSIPRRADDFIVDGNFDYKRFSSFVENRLGINVQRFIDVQKREMLAEKIKQMIAAGVKVTPAEVKADYEARETQSTLEFVRFSGRLHEAEITPTAQQIADYVKQHEADLRKQFDDRAFLYKKLDKQARLRLLLASAQPKPVAGEAPQDNVKPSEADYAAAEKRARTLREEVSDVASFTRVARAESDDGPSKARGGLLGWRKKGFTGLGAALDEKVFAAKAGDIIGPEKTERGYEILLVEGFREGDVPFEQVAPEIAEEKLRGELAEALAKADADKAVAAHDPQKTLADEFPKPKAPEGEAASPTPPGPVAEDTGSFGRKGDLVPQLGVSGEVMKAAFSLKAGQLGGPFNVAGSWVVIRVKERKDPDLKYFEEHKDAEARQMERQKWADVVEEYTKAKCIEARDAGRIKANEEVLSYEGAEGPAVESKYVPCGNKL